MTTRQLINRLALVFAFATLIIGVAAHAPAVVIGGVFWTVLCVGWLLDVWARGRE